MNFARKLMICSSNFLKFSEEAWTINRHVTRSENLGGGGSFNLCAWCQDQDGVKLNKYGHISVELDSQFCYVLLKVDMYKSCGEVSQFEQSTGKVCFSLPI